MTFLNSEIEAVKTKVSSVKLDFPNKCHELDRQHELLQAYVARENLVVIGVEKVKDIHGKEDTKEVFRSFLLDTLELRMKLRSNVFIEYTARRMDRNL